jgi:hypothetical protein
MHFFTAATALIASTAVVLAAPAPSSNAAAMQSINDSAAATLQQLQANGCNYLSMPDSRSRDAFDGNKELTLDFFPTECVAALASETAACGAAAAELGVSK